MDYRLAPIGAEIEIDPTWGTAERSDLARYGWFPVKHFGAGRELWYRQMGRLYSQDELLASFDRGQSAAQPNWPLIGLLVLLSIALALAAAR